MTSREEYVKKLDEIAENYHQADVPDKFIEELCQEYTTEWINEKLKGASSVLELGYGDGIISASLMEQGINFDLVEGSPKVVEVARKALPGVTVSESLFEEFNPGKTYDVVLALHVIEHVDDPVEMLQHMSSWLNPGGTLLIIVPNKNSLHRQLAVIMGLQPELDSLSPRDIVVGHQRVYSLETLRKDVKAAGYAVVEETGFFLKTLPNSMMLEHSPELINALNTVSESLPADMLANIGMVACPR